MARQPEFIPDNEFQPDPAPLESAEDRATQGLEQIVGAGAQFAKDTWQEADKGRQEYLSSLKELRKDPRNTGAWDVLAKGALSGVSGAVQGPAKKAEEIVLEHYSHVPNLKVIDPKFMGKGFDAMTKGRESWHPQSFYYRAGTPAEAESAVGASPYKYTAKLPAESVYDIGADPKGIVAKAGSKEGPFSMDDVHQALKDAGYKGYFNSKNERLGNVVVSYEALPAELAKKEAGKRVDLGSEFVRAIADRYAKPRGMKLGHEMPHVKVNPDFATQVAAEYDKMRHNPADPEVKSAYSALINQTMDQFRHLRENGLKIDRIEPGMKNPYKNSKEVHQDIAQNNHLWYYPTEEGFGSGQAAHGDHPLLAQTGEEHNGKPLLANDIFRIVHDYFGHAKEGTSFGPHGEETAYRIHKQMYSPLAQRALLTETRGQNSWVNFGPHGASNRSNPANTVYAEQKAGLLPEWAGEDYASHEGELKERLDRAKEMGFETGAPYYHGTTKGPFDEFEPTMSPRESSGKIAGFFSKNKQFAEKYTGDPYYSSYSEDEDISPYIHKVYLKAKNVFDYENPKHIDKLAKKLAEKDALSPRFFKLAPKGDWDLLESPEVVDAIQSLGFDSMHVAEEGEKNIAVFKPSQIRWTSAKFDKKKAKSGKLAAGLIGGTGAALGASSSQESKE